MSRVRSQNCLNLNEEGVFVVNDLVYKNDQNLIVFFYVFQLIKKKPLCQNY